MSRKFALIIGNSEYEDANLARLATPDADVHALSELLRASGIGGFEEVSTLVNRPFSEVHPAIADFFAEKKPGDLLLLYFSGHGLLDEQGRLYLAVKNTRRNRVTVSAISASFITDEMNSSRSRRQVLILDCCHSGAFARGAKSAADVKAITRSTFEVGYGRVVLTATDATQYAWEGDEVIGRAENSVFTHYLIQGLQTGEADVNGDGQITLDELYDYVFERVRDQTARQTPSKFSYKEQGEIVIARNPHPVTIKPVELPSELKHAVESPLPSVREAVVRDLAQLVQGSHPGLASTAHEALQRLAQDDSRRVATAAAQALAESSPGTASGPSNAPERAAQKKTEPQLPAAQKEGLPGSQWLGLILGGRYKLEALLGQGSLSSVYRATDPNLRRTVAIKLIHPHLSSGPEFAHHFEREAAAVARLRHPNIIQVFDFGHEGDVYYIVQEFVPGETLQTKLSSLHAAKERLPVAEVVRIVAEMCDALDYAHQRGVIHRDIKPSNILLNPQGQPVLTDFGIARLLSSSSFTSSSTVVGTPAYMSPEQVRGERPDHRADIYALGVTLYQMAAGQPPFEADTPMALMLKHVSASVPDIRQFGGEAVVLKEVIDRALAKDPNQRFQSAAEMGLALRQALAGPQVQERVLDAAIAKRVPVGKSTQLVAQLRRVESEGLRAILEIDDSYAATKDEITKSQPFELEFPADARGRPRPAELVLEIDSPDFTPPSQKQTILVPPKGDSAVHTFQLTPKRAGALFLTLRVFTGEVCVASRPLKTDGEVSDQDVITQAKELVSIPLTVNVFYPGSVHQGGINLNAGRDVSVGEFVGGDKTATVSTGRDIVGGDVAGRDVITTTTTGYERGPVIRYAVLGLIVIVALAIAVLAYFVYKGLIP